MQQLKKILVIEDEEFIREALRDILTECEYEVVVAAEGSAGFDLAVSQNFDLVISDIKLPGKTGVEIFQEVRQQKKIPFILMTGFSEVMDMQKAYEIGVSEFIAKPFSRNDILSALEVVALELVDGQDRKATGDANFCQIFAEELTQNSNPACDIFLKLSANKYVKIARGDMPMGPEKVKFYIQKGVKYFYVSQKDFLLFSKINLQLAPHAGSVKPVAKRQKLQLMQHSMQVCLPEIAVTGLSADQYDIAKTYFESFLNLIAEHEAFCSSMENIRDLNDKAFVLNLAVAFYSVLLSYIVGSRDSASLFKIFVSAIYKEMDPARLPIAVRAYHQEDNAVVKTASAFCDLVLGTKKESRMTAHDAAVLLSKDKSSLDMAAFKAIIVAFQLQLPAATCA